MTTLIQKLLAAMSSLLTTGKATVTDEETVTIPSEVPFLGGKKLKATETVELELQ